VRRALLLGISILFCFGAAGCASFGQKMKSWMGGGDSSASKSPQPAVSSFQNSPAVMVGQERKYKRVTKDNFSDDQAVEENAGSLWRKEGQGSYLFAQNNLRIIGDIVSVQVEGKAAENLTAKLTTIKMALAKLEPPIVRKVASVPSPGVPRPDKDAKVDANQAGNQPAPETAQEEKTEEKTREQIGKFDDVPCRIIEKNADGSYRIKGQSPVYVGRREYRLIVTGIVRPEELAMDAIGSGKLIDSKFDLVATNKEVR
jgi:flagellar L-ring protein precursor FlgH